MKSIGAIPFLLILFIIFAYVHFQEDRLDLTNFIRQHDYPAEEHQIQTDDGYLLKVHRIPHGVNDTHVNRKAVLLIHGLHGNAANFFILGPRKSLGFMLADNGYDVWAMNSRGTFESSKHIFLDEKENRAKFYNFSWHEIGYFDIPNTIDYILEKTNNKKLHYIGNSQGTTTFFVLITMKPEYNEKISLGIMLAPTIFGEYIRRERLLTYLISYCDPIFNLLYSLKIYTNYWLLKFVMYQSCTIDILKPLCYMICDAIGGYGDPEQTEIETIRKFIKIFPDRASFKQIHHFFQLASNKFRQFDYGSEGNMRIYGTEEPPEYNLDLVNTSVALYVGQNDRLSTVEDNKRLASLLKGPTSLKIMSHKNWNHFDFVTAKDVVTMLYDDVIHKMNLH